MPTCSIGHRTPAWASDPEEQLFFHWWAPEHGSNVVPLTRAKGGQTGNLSRHGREIYRGMDELSLERRVKDLDPTILPELRAKQCGRQLGDPGWGPPTVKDHIRQ